MQYDANSENSEYLIPIMFMQLAIIILH